MMLGEVERLVPTRSPTAPGSDFVKSTVFENMGGRLFVPSWDGPTVVPLNCLLLTAHCTQLTGLERSQKQYQIALFLRREVQLQHQVKKLHRIFECEQTSIV